MATEDSLIEVCYLREKVFLLRRDNHWIGWWYHQDFQFSDGHSYQSPEAALGAIQEIVRRSSAVKGIDRVLGDWLAAGKISRTEMGHLQLSLMTFLG